MTAVTPAIEMLWFEPGSAADAAAATNTHLKTQGKTYTADDIREIWAKARKEGRLPPVRRPEMGFPKEQRALVRRMALRVA